MMANRIRELDFLKAVFIVLMVVFHLAYFSELHPYLKRIVYTFHMPAFLIISGYLTNINRGAGPFFRGLMWIFIPYAIMEMGYVAACSVLPVSEAIDHLSVALLLEKTLLGPLGPYWYLHTLIVCSALYFSVYKLLSAQSPIVRLLVLALGFYALSFGVISWPNAMYFTFGLLLRQNGVAFLSFFRPSPLALVPLVLLCTWGQNLDRATLAGVLIVYLVISVLLWLYTLLGQTLRRPIEFLGRNTLVVLLFSPIFTILAKGLIPLLCFDPTGLCFMVLALGLTLGGCLLIGWVCDRLRISRFFFGRTEVLQ
ncbi:MAG: acyltransferase family protein [Mucinivorans sp.]